jgi:GTP1/Obg family GTP-binding protein
MNIDRIRDQILSIENDANNIVTRAHEGTVSMEEIKDFERRAYGRIALVRSQVATLERLEFIRSVEVTIEALP